MSHRPHLGTGGEEDKEKKEKKTDIRRVKTPSQR